MGLSSASYRMIFIDTVPFIYFFEDHPQYAQSLQNLFTEIEISDKQIMTSLITYTEIITRPLTQGQKRLVDKYRAYFTGSKNLSLLPFTIHVAETTAHIRSRYGFKTSDAIQIASALSFGADCILSNDAGWKKVSEIPVFCMEDLGG